MHTIKRYIKKVKLVNPITIFKNWFLADIKQTFAELNNNLSSRVERLEGVNDFSDIEQRLDDLEYYDLYDMENRIESVEDRSETNQESINIVKDKFNVLKHNIESERENIFVAGTLDTINSLDERVEALQGNINALTTAHNMAEELNKEARTKKERSEASLSAMQKLSFEICKYYGGDFNLDDFNNCYDIIKKYDINLNTEGGEKC
jgi:chromosome segregation ATPase